MFKFRSRQSWETLKLTQQHLLQPILPNARPFHTHCCPPASLRSLPILGSSADRCSPGPAIFQPQLPAKFLTVLTSLLGCNSPSVTAAVAFDAAPTMQAASSDAAVEGDAQDTGAYVMHWPKNMKKTKVLTPASNPDVLLGTRAGHQFMILT